jgi:hypothetical protein
VTWLRSRHHDTGYAITKFTKREIADAAWLSLEPQWHHGYPQPDELHNGYLKATYDLTEYCPKCGMGKAQNAPFQMKGEPHWGRRGILQMHWADEEYFVKPDVWEATFKPHGIDSRPVLNRRRTMLETVVQLVIEERVSMDVAGLESSTCAACGRVKYGLDGRGPRPALMTEPHGHMARTSETIGAGAAAFGLAYVSQALASAIQAAKVTGASFWPAAAR